MATTAGNDDTLVIKGSHYWWFPALAGGALVAGGIAVAAWPGRSVKLVTLIAGIVLIANGLLEVITALTLRRELPGWGFYLASGIWSFAFGVPLALVPDVSARALAILLGIFLIFGGVIGIAAGAVVRHGGGRSGHYIVRGVLTAAVGAAAIAWPAVTLGVIAIIFALWMVIIGMMLIAAGVGISGKTVVVTDE